MKHRLNFAFVMIRYAVVLLICRCLVNAQARGEVDSAPCGINTVMSACSIMSTAINESWFYFVPQTGRRCGVSVVVVVVVVVVVAGRLG